MDLNDEDMSGIAKKVVSTGQPSDIVHLTIIEIDSLEPIKLRCGEETEFDNMANRQFSQ